MRSNLAGLEDWISVAAELCSGLRVTDDYVSRCDDRPKYNRTELNAVEESG